VIEYGAEMAAGVRTRPAIFRSLCDHSGLTMNQLEYVAEAEGVPTAIAYAVWKGQQRARGRRMVEARRRLVGYYESTPGPRVLAASNPPGQAVRTCLPLALAGGMAGEGYPFRSL
jgi:hypothetical protein